MRKHRTKMQKKNEDSKDDELNNDSETTAPSNVTVTEKMSQDHKNKPNTQPEVTVTEQSNQNHETKPSDQSEVIATEKLNQNHETKPSAQSEVFATEKLNQNHETKPSAQSEVTATENLSQDHETKPSAQSEVTVTEKLNQNLETGPSAQSEVTTMEKLNQDHKTKSSAQSEVTAKEKFNQNYETKSSAQSEVIAIEKLNQDHKTKPSAQSEVTATEKLNQNRETKPNAQSEVTATEKLSQHHETKPSAQSEVIVTEKLNQNHDAEVTATGKLNQDRETTTNALSEVTPKEKFNQNYETKPSAQSEVTAIEKLNQDHETKPSAQSEVTAIEKLNQDHETKPSAQSEVSYIDWRMDEKIKNITKNLHELQARKAQLQQANNAMCIHSSDFLLFHILLSQEKEKEIKRLYDAEAQLQKANSDIKNKEKEINKLIKQKEEEINNLTGRLHDVEAQLQQANTNIIDKVEEYTKLIKEKEEEIYHLTTRLHDVETQLQKANSDIVTLSKDKEQDVKKNNEENKYLKGKLNDAEANLLNITELKVNLEKEIIDLTAQNKSLREKVDSDNELLSRILREHVAENTNESHPLFENQTTGLNSVMNINSTIQNRESKNEVFTANDEPFNTTVDEVRLFLPNKTEQYDLVIKELKLIFETRITSILDKIHERRTTSIFESRLKNTTIHAEDIDELTEKYNGLNIENVEQLRGDVPSSSTEPKNKKKYTREEPTGNGSVKRRVKEVSVDSSPTGHLRHKGADSKPMLGYDIEGHRMFCNAKMENDVLLACSTEEISKTNPIAVTLVQNIGTFEKPTNTDKKLIQMKIVVSATCDGDIPVETAARVQRMEVELRDAKAKENKLREQLNEYKNAAMMDKTTKIVRKKRQLQHDQCRPYQP